jgi:3-dehydroquinate synthase
MLPDHIQISDDPGRDLRDFLSAKNYSKVILLVDENTAAHCYPQLSQTLGPHDLIQVKSGETHKNLSSCEHIWLKLTEFHADRHSVLIILGGGVLGDMGGFCAATFKRGIDFIMVPTTLLAQADASIGGKLGIDFQNFKNHLGVFRSPVFTLLHYGFLITLPENELRSGFAEVVKHALNSDEEIWN